MVPEELLLLRRNAAARVQGSALLQPGYLQNAQVSLRSSGKSDWTSNAPRPVLRWTCSGGGGSSDASAHTNTHTHTYIYMLLAQW